MSAAVWLRLAAVHAAAYLGSAVALSRATQTPEVLAVPSPAPAALSPLDGALRELNREKEELASLEDSIADSQSRLATSEKVIVKVGETSTEAKAGWAKMRPILDYHVQKFMNLSTRESAIDMELKNDATMIETAKTQVVETDRDSKNTFFGLRQLDSDGTIRNRHGICLESKKRGTLGGDARMWKCMKGMRNQEWSYTRATGRIKILSGLCLDAPEADKIDGKVTMWRCDTQLQNQSWSYDDATGQIRSSFGLCLAAPAPDVRGSAVALRSCAAAGTQWSLVEGATFAKEAVEVLDKKVWDVLDPKTPNSILRTSRTVGDLEAAAKEFEGSVSAKVRRELRPHLRGDQAAELHAALHRLAEAAASPAAPFPSELAPSPAEPEIVLPPPTTTPAPVAPAAPLAPLAPTLAPTTTPPPAAAKLPPGACSSQDGTATSEAYPCYCGTSTCSSFTICVADANRCADAVMDFEMTFVNIDYDRLRVLSSLMRGLHSIAKQVVEAAAGGGISASDVEVKLAKVEKGTVAKITVNVPSGTDAVAVRAMLLETPGVGSPGSTPSALTANAGKFMPARSGIISIAPITKPVISAAELAAP